MTVKERLLPENRSDKDQVETGALVKMVDNDYYYDNGHFKWFLYENCMKVQVEVEDPDTNKQVIEYHYTYHEDAFISWRYEMFYEYIVMMQKLVMQLWKNPNYNGYITSDGIEDRNKLLSIRSGLKSKL